MAGLKKNKPKSCCQKCSPIFILIFSLNLILILPKRCLQCSKSFKNYYYSYFSFLNPKFLTFEKKNNSFLFLIYLSMKSLIPIFYCNLYLLIVVTCGLNLVILVSEKSYPDTRTEREPGEQHNLSFSGKTFLI